MRFGRCRTGRHQAFMGSQSLAESRSPVQPSTLEFLYESASRRHESSRTILQVPQNWRCAVFSRLDFRQCAREGEKPMEPSFETADSHHLVHVHVCVSCGRASRRDEPDGTPDARGVYRCSSCGHAGPLNIQIVCEPNPAFQASRPAEACGD